MQKRNRRRVGRPSKYGERTVPVRVPVKLAGEVEALCRKAPRKLPLFVMVNQTKPLNWAAATCWAWTWGLRSALAEFM